ncbi:MAG: site-specific DNA-methyltransferase, partial [Clostridiales Family XIII bacterium]|nr:site-specific DNA-methyltransferase [Clostridiales Family XIII bacterium]
MDKLKMCTPDLTERNFTALAALFPNTVTETVDENGAVIRAIDKDTLAQEINTHVIECRKERYRFTWPDKRKSILLANAPIAAALRPFRAESVDFDATENLYIEGDNLDSNGRFHTDRLNMIYPRLRVARDLLTDDGVIFISIGE